MSVTSTLVCAEPAHGVCWADGDAGGDTVRAVSTLLQANIDAGTVRADLAPETVLRGLGGLPYLDPKGEWRRDVANLLDLLWHGMGAKQP